MTWHFVDVHAHLNLPEFSADWREVGRRAFDSQVALINVGTDLETSKVAVFQAQELGVGVWATVGIHPHHRLLSGNLEKLAELASDTKVVAIGECGLERLSTLSTEEQKQQLDLFEFQARLASSLNKPLVVHCRESYQELLALIKNWREDWGKDLKIQLHFFAGDWAVAEQFLALNCHFSFTGVITFSNQYDEVIKNLPLDRIMIETDSPYVAPVPYRGKRNEPVYVVKIAERISQIKGEEPEIINQKLTDNAKKFFNLTLN